MNKTKELIVNLLFLLLAATPGLYFSYIAIGEAWTSFRFARLLLSIQQNQIVSYNTVALSYRVEHLGLEFIEALFILVNGKRIEWIVLLPLGSILLVMVYFALAHKLSGSRWLALFTSVYVGWYYPRLVSQYGFQTYVWTNLLFLGFLIIFIEWIHHKRLGHSILIILIFSATFLFYQTTPIWIIVAISIGSILTNLKKRKKNFASLGLWALPLLCVVIYFSFDTVFYSNFLQRFTSESVNSFLIQNIASNILAPIFRRSPAILKPFEIAPLSPNLATWATLISLIIMVLPLGYWFLIKISKVIKNKSISVLSENDDDIFIWSITGVCLMHILGYSSYGALSLRVIPLVFPFLVLVIPRSLQQSNKLFSVISSSLLAIVAIVGTGSYINTLLPDIKPSDLGISAKLIPDRATILADAGVFGSYQINGAEEGHYYDFSWVDSMQYSNLIDYRAGSLPKIDYFILDKSSKPLVTTGWVFLQPWAENIKVIDKNPYLNKIYDSRYISIFVDNKKPIPESISFQQEARLDFPTLLDTYLRIVFSLIILIMVPGALLLLVIRKRLPFDLGGPFVFSCLSIIVGICIITIVGYISNFTPIGLNNMIWLDLIIIMILLSFFFIYKKDLVPLIKKLLSDMVLGISILLLWSLLMVGCSYFRTTSTEEYTELFITQELGSNLPTINILSRYEKPQEYFVYYVVDQERTHLSQVIIQPGQVFRQQVYIPEAFSGKVIHIILVPNNAENLETHFLYSP